MSSSFFSQISNELEALRYIAGNPDLISAFGIDTSAAIAHYTNYGISEGRNLTAFSASNYLAKYSDLSAAFGNNETLALQHYIQYGYSEGRTDTLPVSLESNPVSEISLPSFNTDNALAWTTSNIDLNFSEAVDVESGNIVIYKASDDSVVETIDVTSLNKFSISSLSISDYSYNRLALLKRNFVPEISTFLAVSEDSKTKLEWYQEIKNNWKMTINGSDYLFIDSSEGSDNESLSANENDPWMYLSTNSEYTPDSSAGGGSVAATFINLKSQTSYIINPTNDFAESTSYYIQIADTAFDDSSSNSYAGISDKTTLSFTTASDFEAYNYIASNNDLISAFGTDITSAKSHYTNYGKSEGRTLDNFDEWGYLASNNDLMNAFGSDTTEAVKHYILYGKSEGRSTNIFNADSYLNNYADLKNAFGNDLTLATKHYVENGFNEGRTF